MHLSFAAWIIINSTFLYKNRAMPDENCLHSKSDEILYGTRCFLKRGFLLTLDSPIFKSLAKVLKCKYQ